MAAVWGTGEIAREYADFAVHADVGLSPCFAEWSRGVVGDDQVQQWIATLAAPKQQPNLVFAAARWHGVPAPGSYAVLREALLADDGRIRATIEQRATQTNEVGRLATLLPVFSQVAGRGPVALIEAGASAGLCLYPDRWSYRWTTSAGPVEMGEAGKAGAARTLACDVDGTLPTVRVPQIAWRVGVDLHPLDVTDADQMAWLETLIWPEHEDRRATLRQAIDIARADPPHLRTGDLLTALPEMVEAARKHAETVIVFHSAVIAYLDEPDRERFWDLMTALVAEGACHWISNEGARVLPAVSATARSVPPPSRFVLGLDGRAVAFTHGHGRSMTWL